MEKTKRTLFWIIFLLVPLFANAQNFYVALNGNDKNEGSLQHPFVSLDAARDAVRRLHAQGYKKSITVFLRQGTYYIDHTLALVPQDSGYYNNPVIYKAYGNEKIILNGGVLVPLTAISKVSDLLMKKRFKPEASDHIFQVDLKKLDIKDYGQLSSVGFGRSYIPSGMEVFVNEQPFQLARWPNSGFVPMGKVIEGGATYSKGSMPFAQFTYASSVPSTWKDNGEMWVSGYLKWGWASEVVKIKSIDTTNHIVTLAQPTAYGVASGKPCERWFALNIPEELDSVREYYVDRNKGVLYFYPQQPIRNLELSMLTEPMIMLLGASNIKIQNITFECSRGIGIYMEHTSNNRIEGCVFHNLGINAVCIGKGIGPFSKTLQKLLTGYTNNEYNNDGGNSNGILNCKIYDTGAGGILLGGGDRLTLTRGNNFVKNCTLHDVNRIEKTYRPAISIKGVGNVVANCEIYNATSQAILLEANDHTIEYNNIYNVVTEADDCGAIYYGRNPTARGQIIRYNYFHHINSDLSTHSVYIDDGSCGASIYGNVFYKAGQSAILINGGSDCSIMNNLFFECNEGVWISKGLKGSPFLEPNGFFDKELKAVNFNKPPYSIRYPELINYWNEQPENPKRNQVSKNVFYNVSQVAKMDKDCLQDMNENWVTNQNPGFKEVGNDFIITNFSIIHKNIKGFTKIPFGKIGRH